MQPSGRRGRTRKAESPATGGKRGESLMQRGGDKGGRQTDGAECGEGEKTGAPRRVQDGRRQARSPHEWPGCRVQGLRVVVGVGACSRPAAASLPSPSPRRTPLAPRRGSPYPSEGSTRRATGAAATHHPSGPTTPPVGGPAGPQL